VKLPMRAKRAISTLVASVLVLLLGGSAAGRGGDLIWSTFLGGGAVDEGFSITVDAEGNIYLTGFVTSVDFPTTVGAFEENHNGEIDVFVAQLTPAGDALGYATFLGGSASDYGYGIAVDGQGAAYLTGRTMSVDFPTTRGSFDTTHGGYYDVFVVKVNPRGTDLEYATFMGGGHYDRGNDIVVDRAGHAYVIGWTASAEFPTTPGAYDTVHNGLREEDAFVTKLDPTGEGLVYSTFLGGSDEDWGYGIAVDDSGNAYLGILTYSADCPTTLGAFDTTYNGSRDAFVAKLNPSGSGLVYATYLGGSNQDWPQSVAIEDGGDLYLAGATYSSDFPVTVDAFDTSYHKFTDVFVAELDSTGGDLSYSSFLGGSDEERSTGVALDPDGDVYVTGWTRSVDFPTTVGAFDSSHSRQTDAFVVKLSGQDHVVECITLVGGDSVDVSQDIAIDEFGHVVITGWTESVNFPTTSGVFDTVYSGGEEAFVTKLDLSECHRSNFSESHSERR
jgi:hypothetical protein